MEEKNNNKSNVWLIADIHCGHKNILNHQQNRLPLVEKYAKEHGIEDIKVAHDEWLIDLWLKTTKRGDRIYVLGDFIMQNQQESLKLLQRFKQNGCKIYLIVGNHDKSIQHMYNMFESIDLIKVVNFKKTEFPFIEEEIFQCVMCHYPMKSWFNKCRGSAMISGHTHNHSPWENDGFDLAFNVGFDTELANMNLIPLETLYAAYKKKLNGMSAKDYIEFATKEDPKFIR